MLSQQSQEGLRRLAPGAKSVGKTGGRSGWFRIGMASAALSAPLIARWNDLRTRQRLEAARAQASDLSATAQATLGDRLGDARKAAQALVAQNQPRAKAAIKTAQTLAAQSQPRAKAAMKSAQSAVKSAQSAIEATRDFTQTTAKQVAKRRSQLADAIETARANIGDAAEATAIVAPAAAKLTRLAVKRNIRRNARRVAQRNTVLWLAGIGVGVAVAGTAAYIVLRRRMTNATENDALVELRVEQGVLIDDDDRFNQAQMDRDAASALGATTPASASAMAPSATDVSDLAAGSDLSAMLDDDDDEPDAVLIIETEMDDSAPTDTLNDALTADYSNGYAADDDEDDTDDDDDDVSAAIDQATDETGADFIDSPEVADNPAFIGNIHTMIYHPADAETLPAEENQIFFATEEQAIAAGYRRTKRERVGANGDTGEDTAGK